MNEKIFTLPVSEQISPYISQRQLDELGVVDFLAVKRPS